MAIFHGFSMPTRLQGSCKVHIPKLGSCSIALLIGMCSAKPLCYTTSAHQNGRISETYVGSSHVFLPHSSDVFTC